MKTVVEKAIQVKVTGNTKKKSAARWTREVEQTAEGKVKAFRNRMKTRAHEDRLEYVERRNQAEIIKKNG